MASLLTSDFSFPAEIATGIFKKAQSESVLARLANAEPQKFGKQVKWILTAAPKAELVGEGAKKSSTPTTYAPKAINPLKAQVTMRFSQEVQWADEDTQVGVLSDMAANAGIALGRALDLAAIHKINPLTGAVSTLVDAGITDSTQSVTVTSGKEDQSVEAAAGLVIAAGYTPTGIALDPTLSFALATERDSEGRRLYPELGFGTAVTNFEGMAAAVGDTVSGKEAATATNVLGVIGQFDAFRWGVQREIGAHVIEYGDPDGLGDLQRMNQIAIRAEIVYGIGIMDLNAFAKIVKAAG